MRTPQAVHLRRASPQRLLVSVIGAALLWSVSWFATTSLETIDNEWRAQDLAFQRQLFSTPRQVLTDALAAHAQAVARNDFPARLHAAVQAVAAARWLSRQDQDAVRPLLDAVADESAQRGPVSRRSLYEMQFYLAMDRIDQGQLAQAQQLLDDARETAHRLADRGRLSDVETGYALLELTSGYASDAARHLEAALPDAPHEFSRAIILLWQSIITRRSSLVSMKGQQLSLGQIKAANALVDPDQYPVFGTMGLTLQSITEVTLGEADRASEHLAHFLRLWDRIKSEQGVEFDQTSYYEVLHQFRRADLALAGQLLKRRTQLTWGLLLAGVIVGVALAGLVLQLRQRRRLRDISGRLGQQNQALQELTRARTRLLASACHRLRQPAHALCLMTELAESMVDDPVSRRSSRSLVEHLANIRQSSVMLSDMLGELMDMTRLEGGHYVPNIEPVPLRPLLAELNQHFHDMATQKGLSLTMADAPIAVMTDASLLRRILQCLVSNAIEYSSTGRVCVDLERWDDTATITVKDDGPGMSAEHIRQVFDAYSQHDLGYHPAGLGVGLSIVRQATELLRHRLTLESSPGHGTTVRLSMPATDLQDTQTTAAASYESARGRHIGVVENDAQTLDAVTELLRSWGFRATGARTSAELRACLGERSQCLDLLIADLHLQGENGLEMIEAIRRWPGHDGLPALLLTGDIDANVSARAAADNVAVCHKPVLPKVLLSSIEDCLRTREAAIA